MIFTDNVYVVYVDGDFCGIAENEYEAVDVADNYVNGYSKPLMDDDMPDRLHWDVINVNRFFRDGVLTVSDKLSDDRILCYDDMECKDAVKQLNALNLKKERAEAKIRAMTL